MNARYNFITAAIAGLVVLTQASARQLTDSDSSAVTMRPMKGTSFEIGAEHAVSYFVRENGECKLVLTHAAEPGANDGTFTATRFEATIDAGKATRYVSRNGDAIDFECQPNARSVSIRGAEPALAAAR
jgi:hypothetical protein